MVHEQERQRHARPGLEVRFDQHAGHPVLPDAVAGESTGPELSLTVGAGTRHTYTVVAVDAAGNESGPSDPLTVRTPAAPDTEGPSTPANPRASALAPRTHSDHLGRFHFVGLPPGDYIFVDQRSDFFQVSAGKGKGGRR